MSRKFVRKPAGLPQSVSGARSDTLCYDFSRAGLPGCAIIPVSGGRTACVIDPTGAGDVFATAFFIRWAETGDPGQAAVFANVTASMALQLPGPGAVPSRVEVEEYVGLLRS